MKNWKPYTFNEAVECNPKVCIKKGEIVENCEMENIEPNNKYLYPNEGKLYKGSNSKFQNGDTVFARITPCLENGKIAQIKGLKSNIGIGSTEFFVFRGKKNISNNDYVFYLSRTNLVRDTAIISMTGASGRQRADIKSVKKIKLLLPPLPIQQFIASILSAYDDLIEINYQRIKLLEETARSIYKEWFIRLRFPGYKKAKFIKGVPEGWEVKKIGEVCKVARGSSPRPIIDQRYFENGNIPWVKIADATASGKFLFETKEYVNEFGASFSRQLKPGSLIIATSGTLGFCIFLAIEACIHDGWLYTTEYKFSITPEFLFFVINDRTEYFNNLSYGAAIQNINTDILRNTPFLKPSKDLLEKFQRIIEPINEQQKNLQQQNTQLRQIRDRLLPRLISGKLEVKDN